MYPLVSHTFHTLFQQKDLIESAQDTYNIKTRTDSSPFFTPAVLLLLKMSSLTAEGYMSLYAINV